MKSEINSEIYDQLGQDWYQAQDNPVALLRAESRVRNPWVLKQVRQHRPEGALELLDVGCGGGFLSNYMAKNGFKVTGVDMSEPSLEVARRYDESRSVTYRHADAHHLPFEDGSFDVVCAMDFLEHVDKPALVVREVSRILRPGGMFFFYTFNRNWISRLVVIKGVEWFVKNTPEHLHVYKMFVKPEELRTACEQSGLNCQTMIGMRPVINSAFFKMLRTGSVPADFGFQLTDSTLISFLGYALKSV